MHAHDFRPITRVLVGAFLTVAFSHCLPAPAAAGIKVVETEDFRLDLGLRLQPRLEYRPLP